MTGLVVRGRTRRRVAEICRSEAGEAGWLLGVPATDWSQFIRDAAQGNGQVGLICHPDDRYQDVPEL